MTYEERREIAAKAWRAAGFERQRLAGVRDRAREMYLRAEAAIGQAEKNEAAYRDVLLDLALEGV